MTDASGAQETAAAQPDVEASARRMGWRPEGEYKGPPGEFVPADQFVARVQESYPTLKRKLSEMNGKFDKQERELSDVKQVLTDFRDFASRGEQRAYERARKEIEAKRDVAVAHADTEAFKAADAELVELDKSVKPKPAATETRTQQQAPQVDPDTTSWISANPWFATDAELKEEAIALDSALLKTKPGLSVKDRLALVKERVQKLHPDKFDNPRREAPASVSTPSGASNRRGKGRSYDDLPPEAKKACDKFVKTIPNYKREDYVKDYDWSGE